MSFVAGAVAGAVADAAGWGLEANLNWYNLHRRRAQLQQRLASYGKGGRVGEQAKMGMPPQPWLRRPGQRQQLMAAAAGDGSRTQGAEHSLPSGLGRLATAAGPKAQSTACQAA